MEEDQRLDPDLASRIRSTFVFDLPSEPAGDGGLPPAAFLDREVREVLRLVRFTFRGRPVLVDGYITVMDEVRHDLGRGTGAETGAGTEAVR